MNERPNFEGVLAEHGPSGTVNSREGWVGCECGERLHLPSGLTFDGYAEMWDEERKTRDLHVASTLNAELSRWLADEGVRERVAEVIEAETNEPMWSAFVIARHALAALTVPTAEEAHDA